MEILCEQKRWTIKKRQGLKNFSDKKMGGLVVYTNTNCDNCPLLVEGHRFQRELWGCKGEP